MIQDIYPAKLDIDYKEKRPKGQDRIILVLENDILLKRAGEKDIEFPTLTDLTQACPDGESELKYIFEADGISYYLYLGELTDQMKAGLTPMNKRALFGDYSNLYGMIVFTAVHLHDWYETNRYCGRCGGDMQARQGERSLVCPSCDLTRYPQINPVVIVAVHDKDKLLLTKYANSTYDRYALVAGFVEVGESFESAVEREVFEEVGLRVKNIQYFASQPWGITGGLMAGYFAELDGDNKITLDLNELKEGTWLTRDEMPALAPDEKSLTRTMMYEWWTNMGQ